MIERPEWSGAADGRARRRSCSGPEAARSNIAELSQNARANGFGLLGLLAFAGVTLLAHDNADLFAYGAETQLPLVGVELVTGRIELPATVAPASTLRIRL